MKKLLIALMAILLSLSLFSCAKEDEEAPSVPPGFTVIQNKQKLSKHAEKGKSAIFSGEEFQAFLGEEIGHITVTTLPENGTLICNGTAVLKGQTIPADELEFMKFVPMADCQTATFGFTCDSEGYHGKEMSCDIVYSETVNAPPVVADGKLQTVEGISCVGKLAIREPNGDEYTVKVITYPSDGYVKVSENGEIVYTPEEGFRGKDELVFSVVDRFGEESEKATLKIEVVENQSGVCFADMENNPNHLFAHKLCQDEIMIYRYENGEYYFDPEKPVSKMEFLVMAMCVSGLDGDINAVADSVADDDTGLSSGLKGYLSSAYEKGLIKLENGKFAPREAITLSDAAYIVSESLDLPYLGSSAVSSQGNLQYTALDALVDAGILDEADVVDGTVQITKSQAAKLLCGISDYMRNNNIQK